LGYSELNDPNTTYVADVLADTQFRLGRAQPAIHTPADVFEIAVSKDVKRMLMLVPARPLPPQTITVVQNWPSLLNKK
jgi:hypothetical protein